MPGFESVYHMDQCAHRGNLPKGKALTTEEYSAIFCTAGEHLADSVGERTEDTARGGTPLNSQSLLSFSGGGFPPSIRLSEGSRLGVWTVGWHDGKLAGRIRNGPTVTSPRPIHVERRVMRADHSGSARTESYSPSREVPAVVGVSCPSHWMTCSN